MEPCVNCGTVEPVVPVPSCDCQSNPCPGGDQREIRLIAPTRDEYSDWVNNDPMLPEGVLALVKDRLFEGSVEYIVGDGEHTYSKLLEMYQIYAGAPLSRTGKANHSPLAASEKSTLDQSWLPAATSNDLGAVMVSTTGAAGKVPIPASGASTLDPSWLPVSTSGASGKIPIAGNNGKLDPSWFPEATSTTLGAVKASTTTAANNVVKADSNGSLDGWRDAISNAIANPDTGLIVNDDGTLGVDFDLMPTDKFEALLKSLKMLIPLTANLNLYVDTNNAAAADTIEDGRGTQAKPFKTIQAAVDFVTQTYAINAKLVTIRVVAGRYNEKVTLPNYSRTTGSIYIVSASGLRDVTIVCPYVDAVDFVDFGINATGGEWHVTHLTVERTEQVTASNTVPLVGCVYVGQNATLFWRGCAIVQKMPDGVTELTGTQPYNVRCYRLNNGGCLRLVPDDISGSISFEKPSSGYPTVYAFSVNKGSWLQFDRSMSVANPVINCTGSCDTFIDVAQQSQVTTDGAGNPDTLVNNSVTGKRYNVSTGSYVNIGATSTTFPGNTDGTVDSATYSWYK